jgi:uncharacterized protein (DUF3084 family)
MISNKNLSAQFILVAATICGAMSMPQLATAKGVTWTVEMRQAKLMQDINLAQKHQELTAKEAKKLRSDLSDVARQKKKFKDSTRGKLTAEDNKELEESLNHISEDIKKLQLEKRVSK